MKADGGTSAEINVTRQARDNRYGAKRGLSLWVKGGKSTSTGDSYDCKNRPPFPLSYLPPDEALCSCSLIPVWSANPRSQRMKSSLYVCSTQRDDDAVPVLCGRC